MHPSLPATIMHGCSKPVLGKTRTPQKCEFYSFTHQQITRFGTELTTTQPNTAYTAYTTKYSTYSSYSAYSHTVHTAVQPH
jgi:hypothetical protein